MSKQKTLNKAWILKPKKSLKKALKTNQQPPHKTT
jgi:hypothetical protein